MALSGAIAQFADGVVGFHRFLDKNMFFRKKPGFMAARAVWLVARRTPGQGGIRAAVTTAAGEVYPVFAGVAGGFMLIVADFPGCRGMADVAFIHDHVVFRRFTGGVFAVMAGGTGAGGVKMVEIRR